MPRPHLLGVRVWLASLVVVASLAGPWTVRAAAHAGTAPPRAAHADTTERPTVGAAHLGAHAGHAPAPAHLAIVEGARCDAGPTEHHRHGGPDCPWCAAGRWLPAAPGAVAAAPARAKTVAASVPRAHVALGAPSTVRSRAPPLGA